MTKPAETITVNGKEILMSAALLSLLAGLVADPENIGAVSADQHIREEILKAVLSDRDENGVITTPANLFKVKRDDAEAVIAWVSEHVMDFFMKGLEIAGKVMGDSKDRMTAIAAQMPSLSGTAG